MWVSGVVGDLIDLLTEEVNGISDFHYRILYPNFGEIRWLGDEFTLRYEPWSIFSSITAVFLIIIILFINETVLFN